MALDPVVLDNNTWTDITSASLLGIPAASGGRWTLYAPVDPGITLLDLYAWLLEQRLYWMDQVSDSLTRAILSLLGISPNPAQAATTVLHVEPNWSLGLPRTPSSFAKGQQIQLSSDINSPIFTTNEEITLYPLAANPNSGVRIPRAGLYVGGEKWTNHLEQGKPTVLFAPSSTNTPPETQIRLYLAEPPVAGTLSLLFQLSTSPSLQPDWMPGQKAPVSAGPVPLTWLCPVNGTPTSLNIVKDGTNGLRTSGIVQLTIPDGWSSGTDPFGTYYAINLQAASTDWTFIPRATRILPNVVSASNRCQAQVTPQYIQKQVQAWRQLPGNVFVLPENQRPALASSIEVKIAELGSTSPTPTPWTLVDDLTITGPGDRVFVLDDSSARLRFGDGVSGRIPIPKDTSSVTVSYCVGGGSAGNLGAKLSWQVVNSNQYRLTNVVSAAGGLDGETLAQVRLRAPELLNWTGRAITAGDFEEVATQVPGTAVARAFAAIGRHPQFPNQLVPGAITVYLVPDLPRKSDNSPDYGTANPFPAGPIADQPTCDAVLATLNQWRLVTSEVYVQSAAYRQVSLELSVSAKPANPQKFLDPIYKALQEYFDPLTGGDEGEGWPFGGPVRPSSLLEIAQTAVGDAGTVNTVGIILCDGSVPEQSCSDVQINSYELVELTQVTVALQQPSAGKGGLR